MQKLDIIYLAFNLKIRSGIFFFLGCVVCPCCRQRLEKEKSARETAEAERRKLEEELHKLKMEQERQVRGTQSKLF